MSPAACDPDTEIYERVAKLELLVEGIAPKVDAMHEIMLQGRGATRLGLSIAGALGLGGFVSHKWPAFLAWLGS